MLIAADVLEEQFKLGIWEAYRDKIRVNTGLLKINPHSIDVTLAPIIRHVKVADGYEAIDPFDPASISYDTHAIPEEGFIIKPGDFVLGASLERFETTNPIDCDGSRGKKKTYVTQHYDGRSTTGRLGIQSHMTAGFGDYGFAGYFTLELAVQRPVKLYAGMRIGQVSFVPLLSHSVRPLAYAGAYTQSEPVPTIPVLGKHRF